jgi:hypothetical protein
MVNSTTPFAGAVEVEVGAEAACARKSDGTVWCWGTNQLGELATAPGTLSSSLYPIQVQLLSSAAGLIHGPSYTFCAVMQDSSVVCWGADGFGQAGGPSKTSSSTPTSILTAAGGGNLTGVLDVAPSFPSIDCPGGYPCPAAAVCANTTTMGLVCWGQVPPVAAASASPTAYPVPVYDPATSAPVPTLAIPLQGTISSLAFVNEYGQITLNAGSRPYAYLPPCP